MLELAKNNQRIYLTPEDGVFAQKADKDTPNAVKVTYLDKRTKQEVTKYRIEYQSVEGLILNIKYRQTEYGDYYNVEFDDAVVSFKVGSPYFNSFVEKILNANIAEPVRLEAYDYIPKGKVKSKRGIGIVQKGEKLFAKFFNEKPKDYPLVNDEQAAEMGRSYWKGYYLLLDFFYKKQMDALIDSKFGSTFKKPEIEEVAFEDMAKPVKKSTKKAYDGSDLPPAVEPEGPLPWEVDASQA